MNIKISSQNKSVLEAIKSSSNDLNSIKELKYTENIELIFN